MQYVYLFSDVVYVVSLRPTDNSHIFVPQDSFVIVYSCERCENGGQGGNNSTIFTVLPEDM